MLSFFGIRKDSKKSTSEKEVDGGFVVIGETVEEQRKKILVNIAQPSTNVIVQPSKSSTPTQPSDMQPPASSPSTQALTEPSTVEAALILPDLLGDIPFTLAPHVLAMQAGFPFMPDVLLSQDINLAHFHYDFTLENSVLQNT